MITSGGYLPNDEIDTPSRSGYFRVLILLQAPNPYYLAILCISFKPYGIYIKGPENKILKEISYIYLIK
jgi:hypothetical protein